ncbi:MULTISPECIES: glycosyltransferase [unclassified Mucilaginibacter]|uniref:glycosyltransferase family 2 protein n=1 Tax=unclassified Mucilaginibacter TaxID=2617802 RepID=UPI002AC9270A|nr:MULTISPECIES: glycosyltransferase [unclassified Mucilaginibacter]MEB0248711.1 glycosyltransferase [Mucilaginibacter sp. 5B2]MEB0260412.1 glycosyltransferase [Mucilaginibacter sp. 10I4]MEB0279992.1 glycosyltransferase [Mucilaginibacter sp. 10B2]MEB0302707.1 glycosyltransferase [Mucilaginibacter sp. 5C4]WPX23666.1 glycosyltransferase [Mucilaginibacter sp. 5C4]
MSISIPELLTNDGFITAGDRDAIEVHSNESGLSFIKIALTSGYISRKNYDRCMLNAGYTLNEHPRDEAYDEEVLSKIDLNFAHDRLAMPLRIQNGKVICLMASPDDTLFTDFIRFTYDMEPEIILASDLDITWLSNKLLGDKYIKSAVFELMKRDPDSSAVVTFSTAQLIVIFVIIAVVAIGLALSFKNTSIIINVIISSFFLVAIIFKLFLALVGSRFELHQAVTKEELKLLRDDDLPIYTILLPVFREDKLIKKLIWNLQSIDYPRHKLDIKLLIEEEDDKTFNAVKNLDFPAVFEVIVVPYHMPKTKPKACNYGLHFARGKYLTIYDAEDIPDTDQLKKVVSLFGKLPKEYVCVQSALNYFNRNENFLTRMFTLEYSYWFDYMLPGLDTLDIPIPLGGTSNHFKLDELVELGAWDPFNVTEDADLGVRVYAKGYKVAIINSTTYEEANNEPFNWIRQRSRWIKGYMQTYLVHMRHPVAFWKEIGWKGFLGFNFFIGATPITFLVYPLLLTFFICYVVFDLSGIRTLFPDWVLFMSIFNLMVGNILMIYINMIAVFKRRYYELILFAVANPIYWLMHSISAYKGLYQLIVKPFYWEKTNHGLSKVNSPTNVVK